MAADCLYCPERFTTRPTESTRGHCVRFCTNPRPPDDPGVLAARFQFLQRLVSRFPDPPLSLSLLALPRLYAPVVFRFS